MQPELLPGDDLARVAEEAAEHLPFVSSTDVGLSYWTVDATGHDDTDVQQGDLYALLALAVAKQFDNPVLLGLIVRDMIRAGHFGALEAGFLAKLCAAARAGAMN